MIRVAIMASGTGTNAKALLQAESEQSDVSIELVITDKSDAGVREIAKSFSKPCEVIEKKEATKTEHEARIKKTLQNYNIDWIFLAGYMRILSPDFIDSYYDSNIQQSRIINIHPSLLPHFKGLNAYERAYEERSEYIGISIHFVDGGMDTGKIILQERFQLNPMESFNEFKKQGLALEHKLYPYVLKNLPLIQKKGHL